MIGGTTSFGSSYLTEGDDGFTTTSSSFIFSSNTGYSFTKNLFAGLNIQFLSNNYKVKFANSENNTRQIIFSPFLKYYFLKEKLKPFALIRYGFGKSSSENVNSNGTTNSKSDLTKFNLGGGLSYFFNKSVNVEFSLNYFRSTRDLDDQQNETYITNRINSNIGFAIFL